MRLDQTRNDRRKHYKAGLIALALHFRTIPLRTIATRYGVAGRARAVLRRRNAYQTGSRGHQNPSDDAHNSPLFGISTNGT